MLAKRHLKNALNDGEFILPFPWMFWDKIDETDTLHGIGKKLGSDLVCLPLRLNKEKNSMLVSLTDTKGKNWYSWIHAENS